MQLKLNVTLAQTVVHGACNIKIKGSMLMNAWTDKMYIFNAIWTALDTSLCQMHKCNITNVPLMITEDSNKQ